MKVAILIQNGDTQLVLTPETEWEQSVVNKMATSGEKHVSISRGSFYECRGGYHRFASQGDSMFGNTERNDSSLILRVVDHLPQPSPREPEPMPLP